MASVSEPAWLLEHAGRTLCHAASMGHHRKVIRTLNYHRMSRYANLSPPLPSSSPSSPSSPSSTTTTTTTTSSSSKPNETNEAKRQAILSQALYTAITSAGYIPVCDALIAFDDQLSTYIRTSHLMTKDGGVRGPVCRLAESCGDHVDIWKWCLNHGLFTVHDLEQTELYDYRLRMLSRCAAHRKAKVLQWLLLDPTGPKLFISLSSQLPASPLLIVSFF
jgi:hypothetical protein